MSCQLRPWIRRGTAARGDLVTDVSFNRRDQLRDADGLGPCNITKCCTEVCPEHVKITHNAIIPGSPTADA